MLTKNINDWLIQGDLSFLDKADAYLLNSGKPTNKSLIMKERNVLKKLLQDKYNKTIDQKGLVVIKNVQQDFGTKTSNHFKVVLTGSPSYHHFMDTDDWSVIGSFKEVKDFFKL